MQSVTNLCPVFKIRATKARVARAIFKPQLKNNFRMPILKTIVVCSLIVNCYFLKKICPNLLNGGIDEDRAPAKQSLLRWPCPVPSDRAIPVLWQNLESNV